MKNLIVVLILSSAAAAAPLKCANGGSPRLTGDLFAPVECSSATLPVAELPVPPVKPGKLNLKALDGSYEGATNQGMGRYELRLELKTSWFGRAVATLKLLELQFHSLSTQSLALTPARAPGNCATVLTADALPGVELLGDATAGTIAVSTPTAGVPAPSADARQMDFRFANGALYRVRFAPVGGASYRAQVWWAVPGAPGRSFETELTRVKP